LLAERFQWRPVDHPTAGVAWLAKRGVDVALLDEVQHGRPWSRPNESREGAAFFQCLAVMRETGFNDLIARIRRSLEASMATIQSEADEAQRRWQEVRALDDMSDEALAQARKKALLREAIADQAEKGFTSVAPLFLAPREAMGQFVLIEGVARRAVRISTSDSIVDDSNRTLPGPSSAASNNAYYEVEVFTPDSQNLPIVCCVAQLPDGFPRGDVIHEPVQVAGVFFKKWAYQTRQAGAGAGSPNQLGAAPIVIGPTVASLSTAGDRQSSAATGAWAGAACLLLLAALWALFWRTDRRDRLARRRRPNDVVELDDLDERSSGISE
jgi:hypothetical protein